VSFSIKLNSLPSIRSYADCDRWFKRRLAEKNDLYLARSATWSKKILPLNDTKNRWADDAKRIEIDDEFGYKLMYHKTCVVAYRPDGEVYVDYRHGGRSTGTFLRCVSPMWVDVESRRGTMFYKLRDGEESYRWYSVSTNGAMWFGPNREPLSPPKDFFYTKKVARRDVRAELRKKIEPFVTWMDSVCRVGNCILPAVAGAESFNDNTSFIGVMFAHQKWKPFLAPYLESGRTEDEWRHLAMALRRQICWFSNGTQPFDYDYGIHHLAPMKKRLNEIMWKHFDGWREVKVKVKAGDKP